MKNFGWGFVLGDWGVGELGNWVYIMSRRMGGERVKRVKRVDNFDIILYYRDLFVIEGFLGGCEDLRGFRKGIDGEVDRY